MDLCSYASGFHGEWISVFYQGFLIPQRLGSVRLMRRLYEVWLEHRYAGKTVEVRERRPMSMSGALSSLDPGQDRTTERRRASNPEGPDPGGCLALQEAGVLEERRRMKRQALEHRCLLHRKIAA